MGAPLPPDTPDAARLRREFLSSSDWLTADEAVQRLRETAPISELRKSGRLLGVWDPDNRNWRYPAFQFRTAGGLRPEVAELLAILPPGNGSGWSQIEWLYWPHPLTKSRPPVEAFEADPQRVLDAAREEFLSHPDARW